MPRRSPFKHHRFPRDIIICAVRWYLRYPLSRQDVVDLLASKLGAKRLQIWGNFNHHRRLEEAQQHQATAQCFGLTPTGSGNHHPDATQANHAQTFNLDKINWG